MREEELHRTWLKPGGHGPGSHHAGQGTRRARGSEDTVLEDGGCAGNDSGQAG